MENRKGLGVTTRLSEKLMILVMQFGRYFIVGGLSYLLDYALMILMTEVFGIHYMISTTISYILALLFNFVLAILFVFKESRFKSRYAELGAVFVVGIIGLVLNDLLMLFFTDSIGIHYYYSKLIVGALVLIWNFTGRRIFVYKK